MILCITLTYRLFNFYETSSTDSKFDTLNKFYKDLLKLNNVKSKTEDTKQRKITVLKNAALLYYEWINVYEKEYEQVYESKDENWRKKHGYKNLKDLSYQADKVSKADVTEKEGEDEDKIDQELPPWIKVPKYRFNEIKDVITGSNESRLMTSIGKKKITLKNAEKLLEGVISGKIDKKEARKMYNNIADDANKLNRLELTEPRKKCFLF